MFLNFVKKQLDIHLTFISLVDFNGFWREREREREERVWGY